MGGLFSRRRQHPRRPANDVPFNKDSSILIVGAGPGGIHVAHLLKLKGYTNVKILEKEKKAGGKAKTLFIDESGDVPQDVGASCLHVACDRMIKLAKEYGTTLTTDPASEIAEVVSPEVRKKLTPGVDPNKPIGPIQYMFDKEEVERIPKSCWCLPASIEGPTVLAAVLRFVCLCCFVLFCFSLPTPLLLE